MTDTNTTRLSYGEELTTFKTFDGGNYQTLRYTGESLALETGTTTSQEIRDDRSISDIIRTSLRSAGDINGELSIGAYSDFFSAGMGAATPSGTGKNADISATVAGAVISGTGIGTNVTAGMWVQIYDSGDQSFYGYYRVTAAATGSITVQPTPDSAINGNTVDVEYGDQCVHGTSLRTFHIEKRLILTTNEFPTFRGMAVDGMRMAAATEQVVTCGFTFLGADEASPTPTTSAGGGYDAATSDDVLNTIDHVYGILVNGSYVGSTQASFQTTGNIRARAQMGTLGAASLGTGSFEPTGQFQGYYASATQFNTYLAFNNNSVAYVFRDSAGKGLVFDFPRVRFTSGRRVSGSRNSDVIGDIGWSGKVDANNVMMRMTEFPIPT